MVIEPTRQTRWCAGVGHAKTTPTSVRVGTIRTSCRDWKSLGTLDERARGAIHTQVAVKKGRIRATEKPEHLRRSSPLYRPRQAVIPRSPADSKPVRVGTKQHRKGHGFAPYEAGEAAASATAGSATERSGCLVATGRLARGVGGVCHGGWIDRPSGARASGVRLVFVNFGGAVSA